MLKFFRIPFALSGDKATIPDTVDAVTGSVSYPEGFGFNYQRDFATDPLALNIPRDQSNQLYFDITSAIAELQAQGVPDFITSALNGGTAYSYAAWAIVRYSGDLYLSLDGSNTALPTDATKWALLPTPARLQSALNTQATAAGTVDALTAAFTPAIAALPSAPGTLSVLVRAGGANLTTTPTFKADGTAAKVIVKGANTALASGDIAGAGHWLRMDYDATLDKWVLLNPAKGVSGATVPDASTTVKGIVELATDAETITGTDADRAVTPHGLAAASAADNRRAKAWCNFNGTSSGTISPRAAVNVSSVTKNGAGDYTINFTSAMTDANYVIQASFGSDASTDYYTVNTAITTPTTTSCRVRSGTVTATAQDALRANIAIHGN